MRCWGSLSYALGLITNHEIHLVLMRNVLQNLFINDGSATTKIQFLQVYLDTV